MTEPDPADRRLYRRLLRVFPAEFRDRWGTEMEETFLALLLRARRRGRSAVAAVWIGAAWDAACGGSWRRMRRMANGSWRGGGDAVETILSDVRFAVRALVRQPALFATVVVTLALGIGANTAIFSVVNGLLLEPLPYPEPDRLVALWAEHRARGWSRTDVNLADAWDWGARSGVVESLVVFDDYGMTLTGGDRPERVDVVRSTEGVFEVLGVSPVVGRGFTAEDTRPGSPGVAILTDAYWDRRFGRDPAAVGATLVLDDRPHTVVGVLPPEFVFLDERPELFVPLQVDPVTAERGHHTMEAVARLRPGIDLEGARRAIGEVALQLQTEHPEQNRGWTAQVIPVREELLGDEAPRASAVLMGAVLFILLMACTNVSNLLLARADGRRTEIAVRSALGAGRGRIVRQLLVESLLLAAVGGAAGMVVAVWGQRAIVANLPETLPPVFDFGLGWPVFAFATGVSLLAAALFGLVPALRASAPAAGELRSGGRGAAGGSRRFGGFLVMAQTALAVVLLIGSGIMIRSVVAMARQDMGFEPRGVLTVALAPSEARHPDAEAVHRFWDGLVEGVRELPGVREAGTIQALPLGGSNWGGTFWVAGVEDPREDEGRAARFGYISPGYLAAMGIEVVEGRGVGEQDAQGPAVALVNEAFVRTHLPEGDVLGTGLLTSGVPDEMSIVGVVEDHLERGIDEAAEPAIYVPVARAAVRARTLVLRAAGDPRTLVDPVREAVWALDPDEPVSTVRTMDEWVDQRVGGYRVIAQVMGVFGLLSLALGAIGIYGVTAYGVGRRTREIGVRMAMGADAGDVVGMVLAEGMRKAALGLAVGLGLAVLLTRTMTGLLFDVTPTDPLTFGVVVLTLVVVGTLGSWLPARRASGVDPMRALAGE